MLFTCPHCGNRTHVPESMAGAKGPCARCGQNITVPHSAADLERPPPLTPIAQAAANPAAAAAAKQPRAWKVKAIVLTLVALPLLLCVLPIVLGFVVPAIGKIGEGRRRSDCAANMQRIGQALLAYHEAHGSFPPAYLADEKGRPQHSWRVLILPYLGEEALYAEYHFDEPWNGPNNQKLAARMPAVYRCPSDTSATADQTSYQAVLGAGFVFDGAKTVKLDDIQDGADKTILFVEAHGAAVSWLEPRDRSSASLDLSVGEGPTSAIDSQHEGGAQACLADGTPIWLEEYMDNDQVKARFTIAGDD
jgi:hypothetical protein